MPPFQNDFEPNDIAFHHHVDLAPIHGKKRNEQDFAIPMDVMRQNGERAFLEFLSKRALWDGKTPCSGECLTDLVEANKRVRKKSRIALAFQLE